MMRPSKDEFQELRELIEKALDGSISVKELDRLDDFIVNDPVKRQYYCEYIHMSIGLMRLCGYAPLTGVEEYDKLYFETLWNALMIEEKAAPAVVTEEPAEMTAEEQPKQKDTQKVNKFSLFMAAACFAVLLLVLTAAHIYQMLIPKEVATLSTSLHATFTEEETLETGARLTNRKVPLFLRKGLVEIIFDEGAKVLVEAPATFRLKSAGQIVLYTGQMFAFVPESAQGFTVETPYSRIIDMGTEFGVRVEQDGTSDLHLFKGKAELTSGSDSKAKQTLRLAAGEAKRVESDGQVRDIQIEEETFARYFYSPTEFVWRGQRRLCLVDFVAKGNGLGSGEANIYVNPIRGYSEKLYCYDKSEGYHELTSNPFVDGLFIPDGKKMQIVSSGGHKFAECPKTNGECYAMLGANPIQGIWRSESRNGIVEFNGVKYGDKCHPCLVMHANLGITFDLNAIRAMCPDINVARMVSKIGIADFKEHKGCNADFWVLVDGQICEFRRNVTQKGVLSDISIEIAPSGRFLTLVTTDGGDIDQLGYYKRAFTCDWCVFAEPALILEREEGTITVRTK